MKLKHTPVLLKEVIEYLDPKSGENFIDCTFGGGGHALEILKRIQPDGKLLGIDASVEIKKEIKDWEAEIRERLTLINDNFVNLKQIYEQHFDYPVSGILFDLGISSDELEKSGRGFSFLRDEALDMRFDAEGQRLTAAEVLNKYGYDKLVEIFRDFGEIKDRPAKEAAGQIVKSRRKNRLETTFDLIEIILSVFYPEPFASGKLDVQTKNFYARGKKIIHPATLFFQALRIEVNDELENLEKVLPQAVEILKPGGRLAVIAFHSLEDRIVKNYFRDWAREGAIKLLIKKPLIAGEEELAVNPRSRSAKLRVAEKIVRIKS